ncbi:MAG: hypothetical protein GX607_19960, partial [Myxococcales bacterium]|nr:hypothetical protein [Myxococcales bacterium]
MVTYTRADMLGSEWLFETPFGEEVRLRLGSGEEEPPTGRALWELEGLVEHLLSDLHDPWQRRGLDHLFEALTGRPPQGLLPGDYPGETIYSPFEPSGDLYRRELTHTLR